MADETELMQALEGSTNNASRLLGLDVKTRYIGRKGGKVIECYSCHQTSHLKGSCPRDQKNLYCKHYIHCELHNTYPFWKEGTKKKKEVEAKEEPDIREDK